MGVALSLTGNFGILCPRVTPHKIHKPGENEKTVAHNSEAAWTNDFFTDIDPASISSFLNSVITIMLVTFMRVFAMQVLRCCM